MATVRTANQAVATPGERGWWRKELPWAAIPWEWLLGREILTLVITINTLSHKNGTWCSQKKVPLLIYLEVDQPLSTWRQVHGAMPVHHSWTWTLWSQSRGTSAAAQEAPSLLGLLYLQPDSGVREKGKITSLLLQKKKPLLRHSKGHELFSVNFFEVQDQALISFRFLWTPLLPLLIHHSTASLYLVDYGLNFGKSRCVL